MVGFLDIETNGLLSEMLDYSSMPYKLKDTAKIWVISVTNFEADGTKVTRSLVNEQITKESVGELLSPYDTIVLQNGNKFDLPALMLFGLIDYSIGYLGEKDILNGKEVRIIDTLIMSRFINPDRLGGHSLGEWGKRTGVFKTDYRAKLIELGVMEKNAPKGFEFTFFHPLMVEYCEDDTVATAYTYFALLKEYEGYTSGRLGLQMEHKLADLAIRRETLGFWFDKDLAIKNLEFLTNKMQELADNVNPHLPKKAFTKSELGHYTPPAKQLKQDGSLTTHMINFLNKHNIEEFGNDWFNYKGVRYSIPHEYPLEWEKEATIDDLDTVKAKLIDLGWNPSEWKERDLTKDAKKQNLSFEKRIKAMDKYINETLGGKYKEQRLEILGVSEDKLRQHLTKDIRGNRAVKVPTSPCIKVGVTKDMCPNLVKLGDTVSFAKDVAEYYTYRHRKSAIAGGDIEEMDFDEDAPNTGYLAQLREDGRISTPAIEIGASTSRFKHIGVANIPRVTSLFGKEMRSLFGAGKGKIQFAYDFASLEARIQGHYISDYEGGAEMAVSLLAEKPNDIHTLTGERLGIPRSDAKSVNYAILYGASANKFVKMLGFSKDKATKFVDDWWELNTPLKQLKADKEKEWIASGKKYITSIDGRRINIRSQHSILNALFQSAGVICAKYVNVLTAQLAEEYGLKINVFKEVPNFGCMISYHDEEVYLTNNEIVKFKTFKTKEEAEDFVLNWKGDQLGAIQEIKKGVFFVAMPSLASKAVTEAIKKVEKMFNLKVPLGIEIQCGNNWAETH